MTLYTYQCPDCGTIEEFRESNDKTECDCGKPLKKMYGGSFSLKGNGFYTTDKRRDEHLRETAS